MEKLLGRVWNRLKMTHFDEIGVIDGSEPQLLHSQGRALH